MARDMHISDWTNEPGGAGNERCGELLRHVVLPAGNLRSTLSDYIAAHRAGLDDMTLTLLQATGDVLEEISQKGRAIASDAAGRGKD
ncbi:MAG: hypothetical protein AAGC79_00560 [Pseudomonadota bacterium]